MNKNDTDEDSIESESVWGDCAECESVHTRLGPAEEDCPLVCEECGAHTEGINKLGAL